MVVTYKKSLMIWLVEGFNMAKEVVKEGGSLLVQTVKATFIGAITRGIGKKVGGNVGELAGGIVGSLIQSKTGDPYHFGPVIAIVTGMDVGHNMFGAGGAAAGQTQNVRKEM